VKREARGWSRRRRFRGGLLACWLVGSLAWAMMPSSALACSIVRLAALGESDAGGIRVNSRWQDWLEYAARPLGYKRTGRKVIE
jgi:hypothetical protein